MRLVDLSAPIPSNPESTPDLLRTEIQFADHAAGAAQIREMFGVEPELLRDGEGWAIETFTRSGTHNSTHLDAPYHYSSTIAGRPAAGADDGPAPVRFGAFARVWCWTSMAAASGKRSTWPT